MNNHVYCHLCWAYGGDTEEQIITKFTAQYRHYHTNHYSIKLFLFKKHYGFPLIAFFKKWGMTTQFDLLCLKRLFLMH